MIIDIDECTQLTHEGGQWIVKKRKRIESPNSPNHGEWSSWNGVYFYSDIGFCLKQLVSMTIGDMEGTYPRDVLDPIVEKLNVLEVTINRVAQEIKDAKV